MKNFKSIFAFSFLVLGLSIANFSCKKDSIVHQTQLYIGGFQLSGSQVVYPLNFELHDDGTLVAFNNPADLTVPSGSGTYIIFNSLFVAEVTYTLEPGKKFSFLADCTSTQFINGTWGTSPSKINGGTWTMTKQ